MGFWDFAAICVVCGTIVLVSMISASVKAAKIGEKKDMTPPNQGTSGRK